MGFIDLTGQTFGRLTVIKRVENNKHGNLCYLCICECGNEKIVQGCSLSNKLTKSCGCLVTDFKDLTGQTFDRLKVIKRVENNKYSGVCYLCLCECGNEVIVQGSKLTHRQTKSCGCYHKDVMSKSYGEAAFNRVIRSYKRNVKNGREFSLTNEEARELMLSPCYYCGQEPSNKSKSEYDTGDFQYNGIDRIDNTKGYVKGNVVPSCRKCNLGKHKSSENEFLSCIKAIYEHLDLSNNFSSNYELSRD